jgi:hypothetical protein
MTTIKLPFGSEAARMAFQFQQFEGEPVMAAMGGGGVFCTVLVSHPMDLAAQMAWHAKYGGSTNAGPFMGAAAGTLAILHGRAIGGRLHAAIGKREPADTLRSVDWSEMADWKPHLGEPQIEGLDAP